MLKDISLSEFQATQEAYRFVLDVRSPHEYALSHIPGAINVPVFSDEEHERIGTLYKHSPFEARIFGASLICKNVAKELLELKEWLHPAHKILIYCARGGQRSLSLSLILSSIGYQIYRLIGGYKLYRSHVANALTLPREERFLTLVAPTGSGKSELIEGINWGLDIEGIASHMGSSFGDIKGGQPSVKMFQNLLFERLRALRHEPLIATEAESKRLGNLILPAPLYECYKNAPKVFIASSLEARIKRTFESYATITPMFFQNAMQKIARYMKKEAWEEAYRSFEAGDLMKCAEILLVEYYDKVYKLEPCDYTIHYKDKAQAIRELEEIKEQVQKLHSQRA